VDAVGQHHNMYCLFDPQYLAVSQEALLSMATMRRGGWARAGYWTASKRDMETNRIFRGFCINRFGIGPLHYISSRSDFGFEFSEIFVFEKRLPDSPIRGVVFRIRISPRIRSQNRNSSKCSARDLGQSDLCKKLGKFGSLPCPFNFYC
jgi:hypothetical protein